MKRTFIIGISCIGSGIGQSIINSLKLSALPIKTIGFSNNPFSFGAYDCDKYDYTPSVDVPNYVDKLIEKCTEHSIDLIIPGLEDDALLFSQNLDKFDIAGVKVLVSGKELIMLCRDKELMCNELNKISDDFVRSYNKEALINEIKQGNVNYPYITKPRGGAGSLGIRIIRNEQDLNSLSEEYIIQELALPGKDDPNYEYYIKQIANNRNPQVAEISIQIVTDKDGNIIGRMASYNKLKNGIPIEIVPIENKNIWKAVDKLMPRFLELGLRGPLNIQGRLNEKGLRIFEMNPRFTGITGLRALMGFNEVEACVKDWLGIDGMDGSNLLKLNYNKFGIRQTADKAIPIERNQKVYNLSSYLNNGEITKKKTLLITGASGYLGQNFIKAIAGNECYVIWAFSLNKEKATKLLGNNVAKCFDKTDLENGTLPLGNVDILLHCGFARPHRTNEQIADSLAFTNDLFIRAAMNCVPAIINVSSQSVYGQKTPPPWNESTPVSPEIPYASAKYSTELMLESAKKIYNHIKITSLRLASLAGGQSGLVMTDLVTKFVKQCLDSKSIKIFGQHIIERLDVRDAVDGIIALLSISPEKWKQVYNFGSGQTFNIIELAEKIVEQVKIQKGQQTSRIIIEEKDKKLSFGMDSECFFHDTNWKPKYSLEDTIRSLIKYLEERN